MKDPGDAAGKSSSTATDEKEDKPQGSHPVVENLESLVVAVILALIIRVFVVEAFVIPTGSMASSLYGDHFEITCPNCGYRYVLGYSPMSRPVLERVRCPNCGTRAPWLPASASGGDRILVNKVLYRFDPPRRWDPFVFVNPTVRKSDLKPYKTTYIKRLVGLPGEKFEIIRGDIVVNGQIQRKPPSAQSRLWMPVYDSNYVWKEGTAWRKTGGRGWSLDGKKLVAEVPQGSEARLGYGGRRGDGSGVIRDRYGYDQDLTVRDAPTVLNGAGLNVVTDLRVSFDVKGTASGRLEISLPADLHDDRAVIDFASGRVSLVRSGTELKSMDLKDAGLPALSTGKTHHVAFYRLDYLLVLAIDGRETLQYDFWNQREYNDLLALEMTDQLRAYEKSGVEIGASGVKIELSNVRVDRDVYYTPPKQTTEGGKHYTRCDIPEGCYFAMGDNSPESLDSRYWGFVGADDLIGKALLIWWHPKRIRLID